MKWNQLQNENAPLRAMLNGKLQSVSEDIYDSFILREIAEQPEQFKMAIVIGNVLGKYQLGISDVWISNRIDKCLKMVCWKLYRTHQREKQIIAGY